jgi:major membrane immunogen (membrane-anchored lipoprotein)
MKPLSVILLFLAAAGLFTGCSKKNDTPADTVASVITQGTWKVHFYSKDGKESTATYSTYTFTFKSDGSLTATTGATTINGVWTEVVDSGKRKFTLTFVGGGIQIAMLEIQEDWLVDSKTSMMIELSNSGGSPKVLHFQKL